MDSQQLDKLLKLLKSRQQELRSHFAPLDTECYRIYNRQIGNIPLVIDRYGAYMHLTELEGNEEFELSGDDVKKIAGALYCPVDRMVVKKRQRLTDHEQYATLDSLEETISVKENGLSFGVNLKDFIDTGLFLDHRPTRELVREQAFGLSVLNLFSYTGSFSVYAAAGGASRITTVDLSGPSLEQAKENFRRNDFLPGAFEFIQADVFAFLAEAAEKKEKWDLIILDPPTFSNSRKMDRTLKIQKDYVELILSCAKVLKGGGNLLFSNNLSDFRFDKREFPSGLKISDITSETTDVDFAGRPAHRCWKITGLLQGKTGKEAPSRNSFRPGSRVSPSRGKQRPERGRQRKFKS